MRLLPLAILPGCLWISAEEHRRRTDGDGDGVPADLDCDDADPTVFPSNPESPCDGRDNDCDPATRDGRASIGRVNFDTLQDAVAASAPGDTIALCPGTHVGAVDLPHAVTLTGSVGADGTVIDATGSAAPGITIRGGGATIRSLTVTGGAGGPNPRTDVLDVATVGGGILAIDATDTVLLEDVVVQGNGAGAGGGVFAPTGASIELLRSTVRENFAEQGGGLVVPATATLNDATVSGNTASAEAGGVLVLTAASLNAVGATLVEGNSAPIGGGVRIDPAGSWTGGRLQGNAATAHGGGVLLAGTLTGAIVDDNEALDGAGVAGSGEIEETAISANTAERDGGGVLVLGPLELLGAVDVVGNVATGGDGGGIAVVAGLFESESGAVEIHENRADAGHGGGIAVHDGSLDLLFVRITDNTALYGGGVAIRTEGGCPGCPFELSTVEIRGNSATDGGGVWTDADLDLYASDVDGNDASGEGGGAFVAGGSLLVSGGTFAANVAQGRGGALAVRAIGATTEVEGGAFLESNTAEDGAAIHLGPSAVVNASSADVTNNVTTAGGAISLEQGGGTPTVYGSSDCEYDNNVANDVRAGSYTYDASFARPVFTCTWAVASPANCTP